MLRTVKRIVWVASGIAFALALPQFFAPIAATENWIEDLGIVVATSPEPQNADIVILTLTEDTLAQFPYRSPIDRGFLANVLRQVEAAGVRAVGFDLMFDQPTEPDKDTALAAAFRDAHIPVVAAWGGQEAGLTPAQAAFLATFGQSIRFGRANLLKDDRDGTVRLMTPPRDGRDSLPATLARALGHPVPEKAIPIVYRRGPNQATPAFKSYPAHLAGSLPAAWLRGKIILIGADLPQDDRHRTPFAAAFGNQAGTIPGVTIHAHALAQLLDGRSRPPWTLMEAAALSVFLIVPGWLLASRSLPMSAMVAGSLLLLLLPWVGGFVLIMAGGPALNPLSPTLTLMSALGFGGAVAGRRRLAEKGFVEKAFRRYVSPAVLAELQADPTKLRLGGERRELTFIFTDVAGFTGLSERLPPEQVASLLNSYLDGMIGLAHRHDGTVDKIVGDAILVLFGAPVSHSDDAERALDCALAMDAFARRFEKKNADLDFGITRIGLNSGPAVVGNFGGCERFDYTAIGDTVNTAARLESLNKHFGTRVAVGAQTVERIPRGAFLPVADVVLKGKSAALSVFTPVITVDDADLAGAYRATYLRLREHEEGAGAALAELAARWPHHPLVKLHQGRLLRGETGTKIVMADK
ncbi:adenylate cyclase [uncultured Gammaproteobacteria bacterium]